MRENNIDPRKTGYQIYFLMEAFETGVKDVIEIRDIPYHQEVIDILKAKKYYRKLVKRKDDRNSYYFFKTKEMKEDFMGTLYEFVKNERTGEISEQFGLMMGYPPAACKMFPLKVYSNKPYKNIFVNYGGMFFASYEETLEEDLKWLIENKPLDNDSFVIIGGKLFRTKDRMWKEKIMKNLSSFNSFFKKVESR